ncbi:hypothetical protein F66182_9725 [Fusarium sp. NRRL 66182]|nr:hypothetical protein F66182_9725 [Fusarium sp. NRRL 66182]
MMPQQGTGFYFGSEASLLPLDQFIISTHNHTLLPQPPNNQNFLPLIFQIPKTINMKAAYVLALPAIALAAATPKVEKRQIPDLLNTQCILGIAGITNCVDAGDLTNPTTLLSALSDCALPIVLQAVFNCAQLPGTN